jgi:hypothetical protein
MAHDLTICSVSFHSAPYLRLNVEVAKRLNFGLDQWQWLVAENTSEGSSDRLAANDAGFVVLPGVSAPVTGRTSGSYQHGLALNQLMGRVKTRFVLILDPDFFILREGWVKAVIAHIVARRLSFFGAPWHPRWYRKYRYFPCVHCLFIDLGRVPADALDFSPGLLEVPPSPKPTLWVRHQRLLTTGRWLQAYALWLRQWRTLRAEDVRERQTIGSSRDTGYRLYQRFARERPAPAECLTPVFRPKEQELIPRFVGSWQRSRLAEWRLRDELSYISKRKGYCTTAGFRECGLPDVSQMGWEEFMWQERPFGFHVRGALQQTTGQAVCPAQLADTVGAILARVERAEKLVTA